MTDFNEEKLSIDDMMQHNADLAEVPLGDIVKDCKDEADVVVVTDQVEKRFERTFTPGMMTKTMTSYVTEGGVLSE